MSNFRLQQEGITSVTSVPNCFIEKFMPKAAGEFVKIYIYLLKCVEENTSELSISKIADAFDNTEKDVIRALKYWQKKGLLRLDFDENNVLTSLKVLSANEPEEGISEDLTVNVQAYQPAGRPVPQPQTEDCTASRAVPQPQTEDCTAPQTEPQPVYQAPKKKAFTMEQIDTLSGSDEVTQLLYIVQRYMGRALSGTDINTILFFYDTLGLPTDVIEYLFEYCVSKGHKSMRYIEKTAIGWVESGVTNLKAAKTMNCIYSDDCFKVLKAFGLSGRQPAKSEIDYVTRWTLSYGFDLEIILNACNRTMSTIHQPSFEYTDSILKKWKAKNVKTDADIKALDLIHDMATTKPQASSKSSSANKSQAGFFNFDQRNYDYSALEEQLFNK